MSKSHNNLHVMTADNYQMMNGTYNIYPKGKAPNSRSNQNLDYLLGLSHPDKNSKDSSLKVNLEFIDNYNLKVSLLCDGNVVQVKRRKGKIENGYFTLKTRIYCVFRFIINVLGEEKTRIGMLKNNNITVDTYDGGMVFIVVAPIGGSDRDYYNLEFEKEY